MVCHRAWEDEFAVNNFRGGGCKSSEPGPFSLLGPLEACPRGFHLGAETAAAVHRCHQTSTLSTCSAFHVLLTVRFFFKIKVIVLLLMVFRVVMLK